jgi:hypothetical protein
MRIYMYSNWSVDAISPSLCKSVVDNRQQFIQQKFGAWRTKKKTSREKSAHWREGTKVIFVHDTGLLHTTNEQYTRSLPFSQSTWIPIGHYYLVEYSYAIFVTLEALVSVQHWRHIPSRQEPRNNPLSQTKMSTSVLEVIKLEMF